MKVLEYIFIVILNSAAQRLKMQGNTQESCLLTTSLFDIPCLKPFSRIKEQAQKNLIAARVSGVQAPAAFVAVIYRPPCIADRISSLPSSLPQPRFGLTTTLSRGATLYCLYYCTDCDVLKCVECRITSFAVDFEYSSWLSIYWNTGVVPLYCQHLYHWNICRCQYATLPTATWAIRSTTVLFFRLFGVTYLSPDALPQAPCRARASPGRLQGQLIRGGISMMVRRGLCV